ncbi:MAG: hypothetical protein KG029_04710 [Bacteroidetes bacterium]|nr:hypothetical protein [Bacteroidota bacterium]
MEINQIIRKALPQMDIKSQCDLPELTPEEKNSAIQAEKSRRARRFGISPEAITLSPEAIDKVLMFARKDKVSSQKINEYWEKIEKETPPVSLTVDQLREAFIARASHIARKEFVIDNYNRSILEKLFLYFTASDQAKEAGIDLNKGILLMGGLGTGKSTIMRCFSKNQHTSYKFVACMHLTYDFVEHGFSIIKDHCRIETIARNQYWQTEIGVCYDDMGTEEERRRYGDKVNAMTEIILNRYDMIPHNMTHITTNLNANDIEKYYGARVRSRMREMFNILTFDSSAPDRRK